MNIGQPMMVGLCLVLIAADQPQWGERYSRNMVSTETGLPDCFDPATGTSIKWSAALGTETYSTPVVAGGRVLIRTNNEQPRDPGHTGDRGVLMCFDEHDGRFRWQLVCHKITTSPFWDWPRAGICSPATVESNRVYIVSNRGEVLCLDLYPTKTTLTEADAVWRFDIINNCGVRQHDSAHCSILLHGRFLYINTSNGLDDPHRTIPAPHAPSLIVLDKTTGRLLAQDGERIGPKIFHSTWSSPALGEVGGRTLVFFCGGNGIVYAFEALREVPARVVTLKKLWQYDPDPTAPKENIHSYIRNRKVSPSNIKSMPVFHNGRLYITHGGDVWWGKNEAWLKCVDAATGRELWSHPLQRHCMSTPAVAAGMVFAADCAGLVHCVDATTGTPHWTHQTGGELWASPLVADNKLYIGNRRGDFVILAATKDKKLLCSVKLDRAVHSSAVAANGKVFVATMNRLYAIAR
ncbi:MAG: PQQ-binding-like beta-propeller repeat protein [Verrucomicrobiae bacterium]|nr:PQQ-binding-like beta-propeller repeat protein [Verrucomicrobiae bacterium]